MQGIVCVSNFLPHITNSEHTNLKSGQYQKKSLHLQHHQHLHQLEVNLTKFFSECAKIGIKDKLNQIGKCANLKYRIIPNNEAFYIYIYIYIYIYMQSLITTRTYPNIHKFIHFNGRFDRPTAEIHKNATKMNSLFRLNTTSAWHPLWRTQGLVPTKGLFI